jgi:hypothetical protein
MIDQIGIALFGVTAVFLTQSKSANARKFACLVGMASQPFWIWAAIHAGQWGILIVNVLYTFAWGKGIWQHWIAPHACEYCGSFRHRGVFSLEYRARGITGCPHVDKEHCEPFA